MAKSPLGAAKAVTIRVPEALAQVLCQNARARGCSLSRFITDLIEAHFKAAEPSNAQDRAPLGLPRPTPSPAKAQDPTALMAQQWGRWSARLDARFDKAIGETLIIKEALLLFVRVWLEHNPPLEEQFEESAGMSAEARFERFLDLLAHGLKNHQSIAAAASLIARAADDERALAQAAAEAGP